MGEEFRRVLKETNTRNYKESVESFLAATVDDLEPKTHCCECTPGSHFEKHLVHIQYPKCDCLSKDYILKTNSELKIGDQCPHAFTNGVENEDCPVACVMPWCGVVDENCVKIEKEKEIWENED